MALAALEASAAIDSDDGGYLSDGSDGSMVSSTSLLDKEPVYKAPSDGGRLEFNDLMEHVGESGKEPDVEPGHGMWSQASAERPGHAAQSPSDDDGGRQTTAGQRRCSKGTKGTKDTKGTKGTKAQDTQLFDPREYSWLMPHHLWWVPFRQHMWPCYQIDGRQLMLLQALDVAEDDYHLFQGTKPSTRVALVYIEKRKQPRFTTEFTRGDLQQLTMASRETYATPPKAWKKKKSLARQFKGAIHLAFDLLNHLLQREQREAARMEEECKAAAAEACVADTLQRSVSEDVYKPADSLDAATKRQQVLRVGDTVAVKHPLAGLGTTRSTISSITLQPSPSAVLADGQMYAANLQLSYPVRSMMMCVGCCQSLMDRTVLLCAVRCGQCDRRYGGDEGANGRPVYACQRKVSVHTAA